MVHSEAGRARWPALAVAIAASAVAVAAVTAIVTVLARAVPPISLGVVYLLAILPVAARLGLAHAVTVSVASMLAFNFFVLPPVYTFTLADSANWLALGVYLATAGVVAELAARDRRRLRESEQRERETGLLADIARGLLSSGGLAGETDRIIAGAAALVGGRGGRIAFDADAMEVAPGEVAFELVAPGGPVGALVTTVVGEPDCRVVGRFLPALASLLAVATDRERLTREAAEAEILRRSDLLHTTILRAVGHDLRSPLTAIRVAGEALDDRALELSAAARDDLVDTILGETRRLDRIVGNLLDFSRLQAHAARPAPELATADGLVAEALGELGRHAGDVRVDLGDSLDLVCVDRGQIRRVLVNLLENAQRYAPPDDPVLVRVAQAGGAVVIAVVDHGPGIAAADRDRIFEPFTRVGSRAAGGTGLGLAIARGFAELNGCTLAIAEAEGGSCFTLAIPAAECRP